MSTPLLTEFDPTVIPFQIDVLRHTRRVFNYNLGINEMLLSGSVGSAKTILACHIIATHALANPNSQTLILRRTLKDLKRTIWLNLLQHYPKFREWLNKSEMRIELPNGSIIYGDSYDDGNFEKFRSYTLSMVCIEEATECERELYQELMMRLNRLPKIQENIMLCLTNPAGPDHWLYELFMLHPTITRKVFYSLTEQNPFLAKSYIAQLKATLDPKMADRMLRGQWVDLASEGIYYNYKREVNFKTDYQFDYAYPVDLMFDFNVSANKPFSMAIGQKIGKTYHAVKSILIEGARTNDMMTEIINTGLLKTGSTVRVFGDASGKHNDTRGLKSDYDIIMQALYKLPIKAEMHVPRSNPPIRDRHNKINALCKNDAGDVNLFVYDENIDKGLRMTKFKDGAKLIEDDNFRQQHVTTALGYWIDYLEKYGTEKQRIVIT